MIQRFKIVLHFYLLFKAIANVATGESFDLQTGNERCYIPVICSMQGRSVTTWKQAYPSQSQCPSTDATSNNGISVKELSEEIESLNIRNQRIDSRVATINATIAEKIKDVTAEIEEYTAMLNRKVSMLNEAIVLTKISTARRSLCSLGVSVGGSVPASSFTASSQFGSEYLPEYGRLNAKPGTGYGVGSWSPRNDGVGSWIQVDFGTTKVITGVMTQGRDGYHQQWVTSYKISCGVNTASLKFLKNFAGNEVVFAGNRDMNTIVTNTFLYKIHCRYVRIYPQTFHNHTSLRMDWLTTCP